MQEMINDIKDRRKFCYPIIMDLISDFIYREKRYETNFSIAVISSYNSPADVSQDIQKALRVTDKMICISHNLLCVVFDSTKEQSYVKAAENLFKTLKNANYHQTYYIATAHSENFDENYLDMINKLFDRLEYSVNHNLSNMVNDQDYII